MKKIWCILENKSCKYGGSKRYNYGFFQGISAYCYKVKKWIHDIKICPDREKDD